MFKIHYVLMVMFILALVACAPSEPSTDAAAMEATLPPATTVPTVAPTEAESSEIPTLTEPTAIPTEAEPAPPDMTAFVMELETSVTNQDYASMQALMSDPIAVGAWRSEWRTLAPDQVIEQLRNGSLPGPQAVQFSGLGDDELATLIGQPPATMFSPDTHIVAALHSMGWGQSASDEAILFVAETDGQFTWHAFLYTGGRFVDANLGVGPAPVGLIYTIPDRGLYQIQLDGQHRQLLDGRTANTPNLEISPDGCSAAYLTDDRQLWLIDTTTLDQQQLAADYDLSNYLAWGDSNTLFIGVWLTPDEGEGPNNGHIATLSPAAGTVQILDEERLSSNRPALAPDGETVAFDVFSTGDADSVTSRLYLPSSGLEIFDPADFTAINEMIDMPRFNPAWSTDGRQIAWLASTGERVGVQVYDLDQQTAVQLHDWDPARFGALIPSPVWSPDGQWLALEIWANGPEGSGIWLLAADGSSQTMVDTQGRDPYWVNESQLVFGINGGPRLYDVTANEAFMMDLPEGSRVLGVTSTAEVLAIYESLMVEETPVSTIMAVQDVPMYNGPDDNYVGIGVIFEGQTARVTGQSPVTGWWQVICPDDTVGNCFVTDDPAYTYPVEGADS